MTTAGSRTVKPQRLVLYGVSREEYSRIVRAFADRPGHRLSYDRGVLEIAGPTFQRENDADNLGRFVVVLTEELGLSIKAGRCTTFRCRRVACGLEPDHSWWIAHAPQVRGKLRIDLRVDPPPDLAIEVDITRRSVNRMRIYARLGVPEVWRLSATGLTFHVLQPNGRYAEQPHSLSFPLFTPADLTTHLALRAQHDENEVVRRFRELVHQRLSGGTGTTQAPTPPP